MKQLEGCSFCIEAPELKAKSDIPARTVLETDNFRVYPTLGMITEGYLLIVPKEHIACVGAMPEPLLDELLDVKAKVDEKLTKAYQKPFYFEHGVIGQTVSHAHVHAVPANPGNTYPRFIADFPVHYRLESMKELQQLWKEDGVYIYFEDKTGSHAFVTGIVPMYARIVVADALGVPERANWRKMERTLDDKLIAETVAKLRE